MIILYITYVCLKYSQVSINKMSSSATEDSSSRGEHTFNTRTLMGSDEVSSARGRKNKVP